MTLVQRLEADSAGRSWLEATAELPEFDIALPKGSALADLLLDLAVPHLDITPLLAMRPDTADDGEVWKLVRRAAASIHAHIGRTTLPPEIPAMLLDGDDPFLRYFSVYVFAALIPGARALHAERQIPEDVSRRTLEDIGRQMAHQRRRHGTGGLTLFSNWLAQHVNGRLYQLGRLQFGMHELHDGKTRAEINLAGHPAEPGDPVLAVHIPDYMGPFSPAACDESFDRARTFFAMHFPDARQFKLATCHSWLLDRELPNRLAPTSNIVRFQQRFTITHRNVPPADDIAFDFVFRAPVSDIDRLPRDSSLQRALIDHVKQGGHWYGGVGWLPT